MEFTLGDAFSRFVVFFSSDTEGGDAEEKVLSDDVLDDDDLVDEDADVIGPEEIADDDTFMDTNGKVEWEE